MAGATWEQTEENVARTINRADIDVVHRGCPNSDLTAEYPEVRIESVSGAHKESNHKKQLLRLETEGTPLERFVADYADHELVDDVSVFPHEATDRIIHLSSTIDYGGLNSVSEILSRHGAYKGHGAVAWNGTEQWCIYFESTATLRAIKADLEAEGCAVDIRRKQQIRLKEDQSPNSPLSRLSDRQREVLLVAYELGYFGPNANVTLEDVAEELDLSTSSIWEHLSKAKEKVITAVAEDAAVDGER